MVRPGCRGFNHVAFEHDFHRRDLVADQVNAQVGRAANQAVANLERDAVARRNGTGCDVDAHFGGVGRATVVAHFEATQHRGRQVRVADAVEEKDLLGSATKAARRDDRFSVHRADVIGFDRNAVNRQLDREHFTDECAVRAGGRCDVDCDRNGAKGAVGHSLGQGRRDVGENRDARGQRRGAGARDVVFDVGARLHPVAVGFEGLCVRLRSAEQGRNGQDRSALGQARIEDGFHRGWMDSG